MSAAAVMRHTCDRCYVVVYVDVDRDLAHKVPDGWYMVGRAGPPSPDRIAHLCGACGIESTVANAFVPLPVNRSNRS